jgi:hypothetical protein
LPRSTAFRENSLNSFLNEGVVQQNTWEGKLWTVPSIALNLGILSLWVVVGLGIAGAALALLGRSGRAAAPPPATHPSHWRAPDKLVR